MEHWGRERIGDLADLVAAALPDEELSADELLAAVHDDPGVVLAADDGEGVAAGAVRVLDGVPTLVVKLLVVRPDRRRRGLGSRSLGALEAWGRERGAHRVVVGGGPFGLWPGVGPGHVGLAPTLDRAGYRVAAVRRSARLAPNLRAEPPEGVEVRRAVTDTDVVAVLGAVAARQPRWSDEVARALEHGTCHVAVVDGDVAGLACHSVNRAGWVGPLGVVAGQQGRGIGRALLARVCRDLMIADFSVVEVPEVAEPGFFARLGADEGPRWEAFAREL